MTTNELKFLEIRENQRHNQVSESELARHNVATEGISQGELDSKTRQWESELIPKTMTASASLQSSEAAVHQAQSAGLQALAGLQNAEANLQNANSNQRNAETNYLNAQTNAFNAVIGAQYSKDQVEIGKQNADSNARQAHAAERNASTNEANLKNQELSAQGAFLRGLSGLSSASQKFYTGGSNLFKHDGNSSVFANNDPTPFISGALPGGSLFGLLPQG